jgi:hypothetical protein
MDADTMILFQPEPRGSVHDSRHETATNRAQGLNVRLDPRGTSGSLESNPMNNCRSVVRRCNLNAHFPR